MRLSIQTPIGLFLLLFLLLGCQKQSPQLGEGPFGLEQGLSFEKFTEFYNTTDLTPGKTLYETYTVPNPDDHFRHYQLAFDPSIGLCAIVGYGKVLKTKPDGQELKASYDKMVSQLEKQYGPQTLIMEFTLPGSTTDPQSWMRGLHQRQRIHSRAWTDGERARGGQREVLQLPHDLQSIIVTARTYTPTKGAVDVEYRFKNYEQCRQNAGIEDF